MKEKLARIRELVEILNKANKAYYSENREIMSNFEYDALYDELSELEKETNVVLSNSPTVSVGYEVSSELPKIRHDAPMLSLDKTKEVDTLKSWLGNQKGLLSWKLDGLTIILTYMNGKLTRGVTRGNGEFGEVITSNAKVFKNVPLQINYPGELIIRGEAIIKYSDFLEINEKIELEEEKYKNPRNLCSCSVRQLNNEITAKRNVNFYVFQLVSATKDLIQMNSRKEQLEWLSSLGFDVVEGMEVTKDSLEEAVKWFSENVTKNDMPSDGLVLTYDDIAYGRSLGRTAKFPKDSIAFKWEDDIKETELLEIEWSASRTGLINPIAVFKPVDLEGTTVSRASIHNISIMENLQLGIGDTVTVYKANMIIPQIADNLTRSGKIEIPEHCPVCGHETVMKKDNDVKSLFCVNSECLAKKIKSFTHFVSRDAMNVDGLSEATIEKLIGKGMIKELADIFHLEQYEEEIKSMEGFGEKSFRNLIDSTNRARETTCAKFLYSLGIQNIGLSNAKLICKEFNNDIHKVMNAKQDVLLTIAGIGGVIADTFVEFFTNENNIRIVEDLLKEVHIEQEEANTSEQIFEGKIFVITGSVEHFNNRNEIKEIIEEKGGKVAASVSSKTNYLINNDNLSNSSKNKKAKELNIPIITEEEFLAMLDGKEL